MTNPRNQNSTVVRNVLFTRVSAGVANSDPDTICPRSIDPFYIVTYDIK